MQRASVLPEGIVRRLQSHKEIGEKKKKNNNCP